jgi:hypothetical protein
MAYLNKRNAGMRIVNNEKGEKNSNIENRKICTYAMLLNQS